MSLRDQRDLSSWLVEFADWVHADPKVVQANYLDRVRERNENRSKQNQQYGSIEDAITDLKKRTGINAYAKHSNQEILEQLDQLPPGAEDALLHDPSNTIKDTTNNKKLLQQLKEKRMRDSSSTGYADSDTDGSRNPDIGLGGDAATLAQSKITNERIVTKQGETDLFSVENLPQTLQQIQGLSGAQREEAIDALREQWSRVPSSDWGQSLENRALRMSRAYVSISTGTGGRRTSLIGGAPVKAALYRAHKASQEFYKKVFDEARQKFLQDIDDVLTQLKQAELLDPALEAQLKHTKEELQLPEYRLKHEEVVKYRTKGETGEPKGRKYGKPVQSFYKALPRELQKKLISVLIMQSLKLQPHTGSTGLAYLEGKRKQQRLATFYVMEDFWPFHKVEPDREFFEIATRGTDKFFELYGDVPEGTPIVLPPEQRKKTSNPSPTTDEFTAYPLTGPEGEKKTFTITNEKNPNYKVLIAPTFTNIEKEQEWVGETAQNVFNIAFSASAPLGKGISDLNKLIDEPGGEDLTTRDDRGLWIPEVGSKLKQSIPSEYEMTPEKAEQLKTELPDDILQRFKMRRKQSYNTRTLESSIDSLITRYARETIDYWIDAQGKTYDTEAQLIEANADLWGEAVVRETIAEVTPMLESWLASQPVEVIERKPEEEVIEKEVEIEEQAKGFDPLAVKVPSIEVEEPLPVAASLVKRLVKVANSLDQKGQQSAARIIDEAISNLLP